MNELRFKSLLNTMKKKYSEKLQEHEQGDFLHLLKNSDSEGLELGVKLYEESLKLSGTYLGFIRCFIMEQIENNGSATIAIQLYNLLGEEDELKNPLVKNLHQVYISADKERRKGIFKLINHNVPKNSHLYILAKAWKK